MSMCPMSPGERTLCWCRCTFVSSVDVCVRALICSLVFICMGVSGVDACPILAYSFAYVVLFDFNCICS